jgi:predicted deacylase
VGQRDEVVAEIIDPLTDMIQSVRPQVGGLIYASRRAPFVTFGAEVMKIVGEQPYAAAAGWRCKNRRFAEALDAYQRAH